MDMPDVMTRHIFQENVAPKKGPYAHVTELPNGLLLLSGQKAWDLTTGEIIPGGVARETDLIFDYAVNILNQFGLSLADICKISCFLHSLEDYDEFNKVFESRMDTNKPSRTVLAGLELRDHAKVELVIEAYRPQYLADPLMGEA